MQVFLYALDCSTYFGEVVLLPLVALATKHKYKLACFDLIGIVEVSGRNGTLLQGVFQLHLKHCSTTSL